MWSSTGRSGYSNSTISGDYDSWDGISPNGKQYKNEATMETRDLSGADYWHLRKQNRPTEAIPAELHMLKNGKANINAYAEPEKVLKRVSKVPLKALILPQAARVERLTQQMKDLVEEYKEGVHTPEEYTLLLDVLSVKRTKAVELLNKAKNTKPKRLDYINQEEENVDFGSDFSTQKAKKKLESCVFLGACVLACIIMLMMSH